MKRIKLLIVIIVGLIICICMGLFHVIENRNSTIIVEPTDEEIDKGIVSVNIDKFIKVHAKDTNGYKIEQLEADGNFWVANSNSTVDWCCEKFGIKRQDITYDFDFEKYEYIFIYGYKLKYLSVDQSDYRGWGYAADYDIEREEPFLPETVFIYEVEKTGVWNTEFM